MKRKVIISILTILISIPLLMDTPLAEGNNVHTWAYGTYSSDFNSAFDNYQQTGVLNIPFGSSVVPIPVGKTRSYQEINFQMTNYMDGYVSLYFGNMPSTNLCDLYVSNATIQSWNWQTGYLSLAINGVDNFTITLVNRSTFSSWLTSEVPITWGGISLNPVNAPAYSLHKMDLALAQTNTTLNNILNNVDEVEGILTDIQTYTAYIDDISSSLTTTNSTLNSILTSLNTVNAHLVNIKQNLNRIEWHDTNSRFFGASTDNASYSMSSISGNHIYLGYVLDPSYLTAGAILKVTIPYQVENYHQIQKIYVQNPIDILYWSVNRNDIILYMKVHYKGSNLTIQIQADNNTQFTYISGSNTDTRSVQYITYNDDEYFNILGFFEDRSDTVNIISSIQDVEDAIRNMAVNVNNMTVNTTGITYNVNNTQVNNSVTEYNTNINQVYNIENSLSTNFDTYNQQFTPDFTDALDAINGVPAVMNNVIVDLYNLPFIKYPVLITLVGIVLLAILGV